MKTSSFQVEEEKKKVSLNKNDIKFEIIKDESIKKKKLSLTKFNKNDNIELYNEEYIKKKKKKNLEELYENNNKKKEIYMKITTKDSKNEKREYILYNSNFEYVNNWITTLQKEVILTWQNHDQNIITIENDDGTGSKLLMETIKNFDLEYREVKDQLDYHPPKIFLTGNLPYKVNLNINIPIEIIGKGKVCLINEDEESPIMFINSYNVKISNITIKHQTSDEISAVFINSGNSILDDVTIKSNYCCVMVKTELYATKSSFLNAKIGIFLYSYSHATIELSSINKNDEGIHLTNNSSLKLIKNRISSNLTGILNDEYEKYKENNEDLLKNLYITENHFCRNSINNLDGINLNDENQNIIQPVSPENLKKIFDDIIFDSE
jgi:parallel beta-helix repeat protein